TEGLGKDDPPEDDPRSPTAGRRDDAARLRSRACVLLAARDRARRARQRPRVRSTSHGTFQATGPVLARPVSLLRLAGARQAGVRPFGRRASTTRVRARA